MANSIVFLCLFLFPVVLSRTGIFPPLLQGSPWSPGVQLLLTKHGLDHVNSVMGEMTARVIPHIKVPDIEGILSRGRGSFKFSEVEQKVYKEPGNFSMDYLPNNKILWQMSGLDFGITGKVDGIFNAVVPVEVKGRVDATMRGLAFQVMIGLRMVEDGKLNLWCALCEASADSYSMEMFDAGIPGAIFNAVRLDSAKEAKADVLNRICQVVRDIVNKQGNALLAGSPLKSPLSSAGGGMQTEGAGALIGSMMLANLWFDNTLVWNPQVTSRYILTRHKGEVSWKGRGGTPFHPPVIKDHYPANRMLYIYGSDFVGNSAFYHAYKAGLFEFHITPEGDKNAGSFLRTVCDGGFLEVCVGDILPQLADTYPDSEVEMLFILTRAPALIYSPENIIIWDSHGRIFLMIRSKSNGGKRLTVLSADVVMKAEISVEIQGKKMIGEVELSEFQFTIRRTSLPDLDPDSVEELADFSGSIVENLVNEALQAGFPVPDMGSMKLVRPQLKVMDRFLVVETDIELAKEEMIKGAIAAAANFASQPVQA